jgi:hypothetical protein
MNGVKSPMFIWATVYSCTHWLSPATPRLPSHLGSYTRVLLNSKTRHLFVAPWAGVRVNSVPDPHVFGPPGSGSTCQRYGSGAGSFCQQAKIVRKTCFGLLLDYLWIRIRILLSACENSKKNLLWTSFGLFIFEKWCKCLQKVISRKTLFFCFFVFLFVGVLEVNEENSRIRIRIWIRIWIH